MSRNRIEKYNNNRLKKKLILLNFNNYLYFMLLKFFFASIFAEKLFGYHEIDINDMKIVSSQPYFVCIYIVDW